VDRELRTVGKKNSRIYLFGGSAFEKTKDLFPGLKPQ